MIGDHMVIPVVVVEFVWVGEVRKDVAQEVLQQFAVSKLHHHVHHDAAHLQAVLILTTHVLHFLHQVLHFHLQFFFVHSQFLTLHLRLQELIRLFGKKGFE